MLLLLIYWFIQVPPELHDAFITAIDKGHIRTMPNRSMPAAPYPTPGALLLGDSFNMRHPLTGGGMTVALSDIAVLRNLLKPLNDLNDADELCKYLESFYTLRKVKLRLCPLVYSIISFDWFVVICVMAYWEENLISVSWSSVGERTYA